MWKDAAIRIVLEDRLLASPLCSGTHPGGLFGTKSSSFEAGCGYHSITKLLNRRRRVDDDDDGGGGGGARTRWWDSP